MPAAMLSLLRRRKRVGVCAAPLVLRSGGVDGAGSTSRMADGPLRDMEREEEDEDSEDPVDDDDDDDDDEERARRRLQRALPTAGAMWRRLSGLRS